MISEDMHDAIRIAAEAADFRPLFDYLADDVELTVSIPVQAPVSIERRGRQSVIRHLRGFEEADTPRKKNAADVFGAGERIVAFRDMSLTIGGALRVRSECALVFDVRDGVITRLAINHELSNASRANPVVVPSRPHKAVRTLGQPMKRPIVRG
jgi:ketosteroid isomerase-like protein